MVEKHADLSLISRVLISARQAGFEISPEVNQNVR
jgi:hypothetical protein